MQKDQFHPSVAAIVTTYRRPFETVRVAIESVLYQTYAGIEIIIVDDSGDGYRDPQLRDWLEASVPQAIYIKHSFNVGSQVSRNEGALLSRAELIAFLDDDDFWLPEKTELQVKTLLENDAVLVYSRGITLWESGVDESHHDLEEYGGPHKHFKIECSTDDLLESDIIGTTSQALLRKDAFLRAGLFDSNLPARQDYDLWIRMSMLGRVVGVDERLFVHTKHKGEQISKSDEKSLKAYEWIIVKYQKAMRGNPRSLFVNRKLAARSAARMGMWPRAVLHASLASFHLLGCFGERPRETALRVLRGVRRRIDPASMACKTSPIPHVTHSSWSTLG